MKASKTYANNRIYVEIDEIGDDMPETLVFTSEREMRLVAECLRELARTGGREVEIK